MRLLIERRWPKADYIIGNMYIDDKYFCNTLERPWLENRNNVSCVPPGIYTVKLTYSSKFKRDLPLVLNVPGRSGIRIHRGNYVQDCTGCLLLGENTQKGAVMNSTKYEKKLVELTRIAQSKGEMIVLTIK